MSCGHALNFDQWKTIFENYEPIRIWIWLAYRFTENNCRLWIFSKFIQAQKRYPTSLDKIRILTWKLLINHIKLKCSLWTKLPKNLLLPKCLISVAATLKLHCLITLISHIVQILLAQVHKSYYFCPGPQIFFKGEHKKF